MLKNLKGILNKEITLKNYQIMLVVLISNVIAELIF